MKKADELLSKVMGKEKVLWRGAPSPGSAIFAELGGCGIPFIAFGVLAFLMWLILAWVIPQAPHQAALAGASRPDVLLVGSFVVFAVVLVAVGPPVLLEWLNLRNTRYAVTREHLIVIEGIAFLRVLRAARPLEPSTAPGCTNAIKTEKARVAASTSGTIELGWIDVEELDRRLVSRGTEPFPLRLRGLGPMGNEVLSALGRMGKAAEPS